METVFDAPVDPALIERSLAASTFGSMWLDIPRPDHPPLTEPITCDLLVIGGGYTGLWTALHAAERNPDRRIVLIEANRIGWAASGRNGGFVDASLTHGAENGKSRWPNEIDTLDEMGIENLDGMQSDIQRLGLDAEWQRTGMLSVATEPHQVDWLRDAADGGEGRLLDTEQVRAEVNSPTYLAVFTARTRAQSSIPPSWRFELARACADAGVHIYERTNATRLDSGGLALRVDTGAATVTARQAVLATNVYPEPAAAQPPAHRAGVRLRAGHRAPHGCPAGPHRLAGQAGSRRLRQPVSLLPADRGQPHRVGRLRRRLSLRAQGRRRL